MTLHAKSICLMTALWMTAAFSQLTSTPAQAQTTEAAASAPVAFVYVSSNPKGSSTNEINGFTAAANGKLTPVSGSPFRDDVTNMASNGKYLYASTRSGIYVAAFAIEATGALRWSASTDIVKFNQDDCGSSGPLFLDHTGASLYDLEVDGNACANNSYQSLATNTSSGRLRNIGSGASDEWFSLPATFIGNNTYAYTAVCLYDMYWEITGFKRSNSGLLSQINNASTPAPKTGDFFCPSQTAADLTNHVAITMQPVDQNTFSPDGPAQLATYTAGNSGNLSTTSTVGNMPAASVGTVTGIGMAPSGKLLAVAGTAGLQVFHFNGASPITHDTGLLTKDQVDQVFWDNDNHLYAISQSAGKFFVFTVTPTSANQAAGSPYTISNPLYLAVQPRTPRP